jgi:hypothetical protein
MESWDVDGKKADETLMEVEYGTPLFFLSSRDNNTTSKTSYGIPKHEVTVVIL